MELDNGVAEAAGKVIHQSGLPFELLGLHFPIQNFPGISVAIAPPIAPNHFWEVNRRNHKKNCTFWSCPSQKTKRSPFPGPTTQRLRVFRGSGHFPEFRNLPDHPTRDLSRSSV